MVKVGCYFILDAFTVAAVLPNRFTKRECVPENRGKHGDLDGEKPHEI